MEMPAAATVSVRTVWANFVGEGTAAAAVVGCEPSGTVPLMVIVTMPSALVAGSEISRSDLDSAGPVVTLPTNLMYEVWCAENNVAASPALGAGVARKA